MQLAEALDLGGIRPVPVRSGNLEDGREPLELRVREEEAEVLAHFALADVGVAVPVRTEPGGGVVHVQSAQAVEARGVKPLEDVTLLAMLRGAAMLIDETLNFLEARDDAFLARGAAALLIRLGEIREFAAQFIKIEVTHSGPHP